MRNIKESNKIITVSVPNDVMLPPNYSPMLPDVMSATEYNEFQEVSPFGHTSKNLWTPNLENPDVWSGEEM